MLFAYYAATSQERRPFLSLHTSEHPLVYPVKITMTWATISYWLVSILPHTSTLP